MAARAGITMAEIDAAADHVRRGGDVSSFEFDEARCACHRCREAKAA
jgi:hypothetical protein